MRAAETIECSLHASASTLVTAVHEGRDCMRVTFSRAAFSVAGGKSLLGGTPPLEATPLAAQMPYIRATPRLQQTSIQTIAFATQTAR